MVEGLNFVATAELQKDTPLVLFICFTFGIFIFRVIETFYETGNISTCKYWSRTLFRWMMLANVILELLGYMIELPVEFQNKYYLCWMNFSSNVVFIIALIMLSHSFRVFTKLVHAENKIKPTPFFFICAIYFAISLVLLIVSTVMEGNYLVDPQCHPAFKRISVFLFTAYEIMSYLAISFFVSVPMLTSLIKQFRNQFGYHINIIFGFSVVLSIIAVALRLWYTLQLKENIVKTVSIWATAIFDLVVSMQQSLMDHILRKSSLTSINSELTATSELTQSVPSDFY